MNPLSLPLKQDSAAEMLVETLIQNPMVSLKIQPFLT
jgi:hypothetical protein